MLKQYTLEGCEEMADELGKLPEREQRAFMRAFIGVHAAFWLVCLGGAGAVFYSARPTPAPVAVAPTPSAAAAIPTAAPASSPSM